MRLLLQLLGDYLWPSAPRAASHQADRNAWLRPVLVIGIALLCGPEVFAAVDLVLLLDVLGVTLFLSAFAAAYRMLALAALQRSRQLLLPAPWMSLIGLREQPSLVAHGMTLVSTHVLRLTVMGAAAAIGILGLFS
jgi:hypothetical protein